MTESLEVERSLPLAPEHCFALWAAPDALRDWWGPTDDSGTPFRAEIIEWRLEEGATWAIDMTAPDGTVYRQSGEMIEVASPRLIRFTFHWVEDGRRGPTTEIVVRFDAEGDGTRLRFRQAGFADRHVRDGHRDGWNECLDRLVGAAQMREGQAA